MFRKIIKLLIFLTFINYAYAAKEGTGYNRGLKKDNILEITKLLDNLSSRERLVLQLRFGLSDGKNRTLEDIGKMLGLTRERIRQIEKKALSKLRGLENIGQLRELIV